MDQADGPRPSVLLVEDDEDMRALIRMRLELDGRFAVVAEASNGALGVDLAKVYQPDAVVLDVLMPVLDGAATLPLIRAVAPRAVDVTFSALPAEHPRVAHMGANAHACKTASAVLAEVLYQAWLSERQQLAV